MKNPWETLSSKTIYNGFLGHKVRIDDVIGPSGNENEYFVVELKDNATILGITEDKKVVMERTWRYPIEKEILELPVGGIEKGEESLDAAKREFKEETGYTSEDWTFLGSHFENDGFCTARCNIFLAKNVIAGKAENCDENELLEVELMDFEVLRKMVEEGKIEDVRTKIAVLLAVTKGLI